MIVGFTFKWTQHLFRMNDTGISKLVYEYLPAGRRNIGPPRKRWSDQHPQRETKQKLASTLLLVM